MARRKKPQKTDSYWGSKREACEVKPAGALKGKLKNGLQKF